MKRSSNTGREKNGVQNPNIQGHPDHEPHKRDGWTLATPPPAGPASPGFLGFLPPREAPPRPRPLRPEPFLSQTLPSPFLLRFRPRFSIAPFDWPSAPEPGRPIGEAGWRRWAWPQSRALRSRQPPPLSRQHIPPPLPPPPAPRSSSPELLWCRGSGQEGAAGRGVEAAEAGREEGSGRTDGRAAQAAAGFLGASVRRGGWGGSRGARAGRGGGRVADPAMADNEKLDNQRLKNFKNKGRDLEVQ